MSTLSVAAVMQPNVVRPRFRQLALQSLAELRRHRRAPDFAVAAVALPVVFYLMFGVPRAAEPIPGGGTVGQYVIVAFAIYGVLSVGLFGIGSTLTEERGRGDVRLMRVTPLPASVYLSAKVVFAVLASGAIAVLLGAAGEMTGAQMPVEHWAAMTAVLLAGCLALAPIGFLVGFLARPGSAAAVSLLILMPLSLAAGVFTPVSELPTTVQQAAQLTPTFHLAALARWAAGFDPSVTPFVDVAWIAAAALITTAIVTVVYRRYVGQQFA